VPIFLEYTGSRAAVGSGQCGSLTQTGAIRPKIREPVGRADGTRDSTLEADCFTRLPDFKISADDTERH
jgi:hypothetical protein